MHYVIHGTSLEAAQCNMTEGLRKGDRARVHFYECDPNGHVLVGHTVRRESGFPTAASASHRIDGSFL